MTDTTLTGGFQPTESGLSPRAERDAAEAKKAPTKRDVTELLKSFEPEAVAAPTPAERERTRRIASWEAGVRKLVTIFDELGGTEGTPTEAAAALKSLQGALKKGSATIASLTDAKLVPAEKAVRPPRQSTTRTLSESDAKAAVARDETAVIPEPELEPEGFDEAHFPPESETTNADDSEDGARPAEAERSDLERNLDAAQASIAEPAPQTRRSGPPSRQTPAAEQAPRGDSDPNANDGF